MSRPLLHPRTSTLFQAAALLLLFAAQVFFSTSASRLDVTPPIPPEVGRINPDLYRTLSFGHLPSAVDWLWVTLLTHTEVVRGQSRSGQHSVLYYELEALADLDPLFADVYQVGGNLLAIVQDDGQGARVLLDKGEKFRKERLPAMPDAYRVRYWERPWQVPLLLAYVHLFELNDLAEAAIHFKDAAALPGAPRYLLSLQKRLERPGGEYEVGLKLLAHMLSSAKDPAVREGLEKKRFSLFVSQYLHELNEGFAFFARDKRGGGETPSTEDLQRLWRRYRVEKSVAETDPWGGRLSLGAEGMISTTTPHGKVFGLE